MSVILTAGKKRKDEKKLKKKKSEDPQQVLVFCPVPENVMSSAIKIWRWVQQGGKTFVLAYSKLPPAPGLLGKLNFCVWVNGDTVVNRHSPEEKVTTFEVCGHPCRVEHFRTGPKTNYRLIVSGTPIPDEEEMATMGAAGFQNK